MSDFVRRAQEGLNRQLPVSERLVVDGKWGSKTKAACISVFNRGRKPQLERSSVEDLIIGNRPAGCLMPAGLLLKLAKVESNMNPNAANPSGALGLFQIVGKTADIIPNFSRDDRLDVGKSVRAICWLWADNARLLRKYGLPVDQSTLWGMHNLGPVYRHVYRNKPNRTALTFMRANLPRTYTQKSWSVVRDAYLTKWNRVFKGPLSDDQTNQA